MATVRPLVDLIDGETSSPSVPKGVFLENPNTKERLQEQMATDAAGIERALAAAHRVHEEGSWSETSVEERAAALLRFASELDKRKEEIAYLEALTTGVPIGFTSMLGIIVTGAWHLAIEQLKAGIQYQTLPGPNNHTVEIHRRPWGPALLLVPWNAPAPMAAHKAANSLAAGCPTILKPTEWAPNGCDIFADAAQAAGIPRGVFQIVHGGPDVGGRLVKDPRVKSVSFTGGLAGGRAIATACAPEVKPAQLELGGNNPVVVLEDADLDYAAQGVVSLLTSLNGQWCRALGWLIVHERVRDEFLDRVFAKLAAVKLGDSTSFETQMGPMIHSQHLAKLRGQIVDLAAHGGKPRSSTPLPDLQGNFIAPTLISGVAPEHAQDEIFGPVGTVHTFRTDAEALALANGTPFGLEGYVFAGDEDRGMALARKVRAGGVKVNGSTVMSLHILAPRPSWGLSGMAEEGTIETFRFFCGTRVAGVEGPISFG